MNKPSVLADLSDKENSLKEKGLAISATVGFGLAADQILDYAKANTSDLIAMSAYGRSEIGRWVFGSVTDKVLHTADTPILVARPTGA